MEINNKITNTPYFGIKLNTASVLETTSQRIFYNTGTDGFKEVIFALNDKPFKATGSKGYVYFAKVIGKQITDKYPEIAEATKKILKIYEENPDVKKAEVAKKIQPIIDKLGQTVDITI